MIPSGAVRHCYMPVAVGSVINVRHQGKVSFEALSSEKLVQERLQQPLIERVINFAAINRLGEKNNQRVPRNFLWWKICSAL